MPRALQPALGTQGRGGEGPDLRKHHLRGWRPPSRSPGKPLSLQAPAPTRLLPVPRWDRPLLPFYLYRVQSRVVTVTPVSLS